MHSYYLVTKDDGTYLVISKYINKEVHLSTLIILVYVIHRWNVELKGLTQRGLSMTLKLS